MKFLNRETIITFLLLLAIAALTPWSTGKRVEASNARPVLRAALLPHEGAVSTLSPYGPGFEVELVTRFAEEFGYKLRLIKADNPTHAWNMLRLNVADLAVGLGQQPPDSLRGPAAAGPAYAVHTPIIVRNAIGVQRDEDSCTNPLLFVSNPGLEKAVLENKTLEACKPELQRRPDYRLEPILNGLRFHPDQMALVDGGRFLLWKPFYPTLEPQLSLERKVKYRWFWRIKDEQLSKALSEFWDDKATFAYIDELRERYTGFLPDKPSEFDDYELEHLLRTVERRLPGYVNVIGREAAKYEIDPLFLAAVIYQESRFDPEATSKTGVRGLMQLTQATAEHMGVADRLDPKQSIKGGAKYLRQLWNELEALNLDPWERWYFTLAAYNQGLGHLQDAIKLSKELGGEGRTWLELKQVFPLLARPKYYSKARYGQTRGYEAVAYVDKVRYYYYVLNGLVVLSRPEAQHLAPLGLVRRAGWPGLGGFGAG